MRFRSILVTHCTLASLLVTYAAIRYVSANHLIYKGRLASPDAKTKFAPVKVTIASKGLCSGTALTNQWILTAAHCVTSTPNTPVSPTQLSIQLEGDATSIPVRDVKVHPHYQVASDGQQNMDFALLRLERNLSLNNSYFNIKTPLYTLGTSLNSNPVRCFGYGRTDLANVPTSKLGILHEAGLSIRTQENFHYRLDPSSTGQMIFPGDSGGSCFWQGTSGNFLVGVNSTIVSTDPSRPANMSPPRYGFLARADVVPSWIMETIFDVQNDTQEFPKELLGGGYKSLVPTQINGWDPCPGASEYSVTLSYEFHGSDSAQLIRDPTFSHHQKSIRLKGTGTQTYSMQGKLGVHYSKSRNQKSKGITQIQAQCIKGAMPDLGTLMTVIPEKALPNGTTLQRNWDPCNGNSFQWHASYNLSADESVTIGNTMLVGHGLKVERAKSPLKVQLSTLTTTTQTGQKFQLIATCDDWPTPHL